MHRIHMHRTNPASPASHTIQATASQTIPDTASHTILATASHTIPDTASHTGTCKLVHYLAIRQQLVEDTDPDMISYLIPDMSGFKWEWQKACINSFNKRV